MQFTDHVDEANLFIHEVAQDLGYPRDEEKALRVIRTVFHTLRDALSPDESMRLVSELPLMLKGIYVDGWKISKLCSVKSLESFLENLRSNEPTPKVDVGDNNRAVQIIQVVFDVLKRHISPGEVKQVVSQFNQNLQFLWSISDEQKSQSLYSMNPVRWTDDSESREKSDGGI